MKLILACLFLTISIAGSAAQEIDAEPVNPASSHSGDRVFCGGRTTAATVRGFFAELHRTLNTPGPKSRYNVFVEPVFSVRNSGRTLTFNLKDIGSVTPGRISLDDWRAISERGAESLQNAGWRGCFLDNGKVWFQAGNDEGFRLSHISKDMPWVAPIKGDALNQDSRIRP